jgi:hypothetical protein
MKILFPFLQKQATLMRRSTVLSLPPQLVFPGLGIAVVASICLRIVPFNVTETRSQVIHDQNYHIVGIIS